MKQKYDNLDITSQHLGSIIRANNRTRKRTRHQHYPKERRKQPTDKNKEMGIFYNEVHKYPLNKIICLDETSVGSHLKPSYSRCFIGKRCVIKTNNNYVLSHFSFRSVYLFLYEIRKRNRRALKKRTKINVLF